MFENKGEPVGVTMPHPHGQIYGYSVVPKKLELELSSSKEHFEETGKCLFCDMLNDEVKDGRRVIFENEDLKIEIHKKINEIDNLIFNKHQYYLHLYLYLFH